LAVRPVLRLPHPVLGQPAEPVGVIGDAARDLAEDLLDTMKASPACVGLAANQIGSTLRAFCVDVTGHKKAVSCHGTFVLFDAQLLVAHAPEVSREGCMSVPDLTGNVARATDIVVRGRTPDGSELVIEADAFEARAILHELDHLDGLVFLDRVASVGDVFPRVRYR
jgi:peptide deformylase